MNDDNAKYERVLSKLLVYWEAHPTERLGQVVCQLTQRSGSVNPFYTSDDDIERVLDTALTSLQTVHRESLKIH
jgi:hypothetical protein